MKNTKKTRPLLRAVALTAGALLSGCGASEQPLPGNPKGSHFDDNATASNDVLVSGTILVEGQLGTPAEAIFVSIRGESGPPLAAKKLPVGPFPMEFELTRADMMPMGGDRPVPDSFTVKVAVDGDGNAMTDEGLPSYKATQARGTTGLKVHLPGVPPLPGNPKGSMYDEGLKEPVADPKLDQ